MSADSVINLIKNTLAKAGSKAVMQHLVSQASFFSWPIVNPIIGFFVGYVVEILLEKTELGSFFIYADIITAKQASDFEKQAQKNKEIQENGTPEEKAKSEQELIDAARNLIKYST